MAWTLPHPFKLVGKGSISRKALEVSTLVCHTFRFILLSHLASLLLHALSRFLLHRSDGTVESFEYECEAKERHMVQGRRGLG